MTVQKNLCLIVSFFLVLTVHIAAHNNNSSSLSFSVRQIKAYGLHGQKIIPILNNIPIGCISYIRIPVVNWHIIYDFFICKKQRGKGYGKQLFSHALAELRSKKATTILIQPGPFEWSNGKSVAITGHQKDTALKKLVQFYSSHGFNFLRNSLLSKCLAIMYRLLSIDEDPHFFMVCYL